MDVCWSSVFARSADDVDSPSFRCTTSNFRTFHSAAHGIRKQSHMNRGSKRSPPQRRRQVVKKDSTAPRSRTKRLYSMTDIDNAVAVGEAVGKFELYRLHNSSPLTVSSAFENDLWTITGEYDEHGRERDYAAEDTLRYHASEEASHATVVILAANGRRLPECDVDGVPVPTKPAAARKRTPVRRRTKGPHKPT